MDPANPPPKRYPACHLVLPVSAAAALSEQLNRLGAAIAQAQPSAGANKAN